MHWDVKYLLPTKKFIILATRCSLAIHIRKGTTLLTRKEAALFIYYIIVSISAYSTDPYFILNSQHARIFATSISSHDLTALLRITE